MSSEERDERNLMLNALASFSDSCTLPLLTPDCPYYELRQNGAATCREQCRDILERHGVSGRERAQTQVKGLVLLGRAVPSRSVSGGEPYDAGQIFIEDRHKAAPQQRTASLLLSLKAGLTNPDNALHDTYEDNMQLWAELDRRGLPVERIIRVEILRSMAAHISNFAALPAAVRLLGEAIDVTETLGPVMQRSEATWYPLLRATMSSVPDVSTVLRRVAEWDEDPAMSPPPDDFPPVTQEQLQEISDKISRGEGLAAEAAFSRSTYFRERLYTWLCSLVDSDTRALYGWAHPAESILTNLGSVGRLDPEAKWLWDRFAVTDVASWSVQSLAMEWGHAQSGSDSLPSLVAAERTVDPAPLPDLVIARVARRKAFRPRPVELNAERFVRQARDLLQNGDLERAADIFSALVSMNPADAGSRNNLGFCLISVDPAKALAQLEEAALSPSAVQGLSDINRALALHLLGRNTDALVLARRAQGAVVARDHDVIMWDHDAVSGELSLNAHAKLGPYIDHLVSHLSEPEACAAAGARSGTREE